MIIIGIDPGKRCGYSVFDALREEEIKSGTMNGDDPKAALALMEEHQPDVVVVEDQFFKPGKLNGMKTLLYRRHVWEVLAKLKGIPFYEINNRTWQSYWKVKAGDKEGIIRIATQVTSKQSDYDEADACLIVRCWWARRQTQEDE